MYENTQETMETVSSTSGIPGTAPALDGNSDVIPTDSDNGNIAGDDLPGSEYISDAGNGDSDYMADSVSGGDIGGSIEAYTETTEFQSIVAENTQQIYDVLTSINAAFVLIFVFLLFEWTEKKIKVVVNRFTDRRR